MSQRILSNVRRSRSVSLAIAAAAASIGGVGVGTARADFAYDLRFSSGGKTQAVTSAGGTFTLDLWARVTGADAVHTNDAVVSGVLSVQSQQLNGGAITSGGITAAAPTDAFAHPTYAQNGQASTLTNDGVADWGTDRQWFGYDAPGVIGDERPVEHLIWYTERLNAIALPADIAGTAVAGQSQAVDANTWEWKVGTFTVTIPANSLGAGANGVTQFIPVFADYPVDTAAESQVVTHQFDDPNINGSYTSHWNPKSVGTAVAFTIGAVGDPGWKLATGGSWADVNSWNGGVPDTVAETAIFGSAVTAPNAPASVLLDGSKTVGALTFNNAVGGANDTYVIAAGSGGTLSLGDAATPGTVTVTAGNHRIDVPLSLPNNATVITAAGTQLATTQAVTLDAGRTLTKASPGKLDVRGGFALGNGAGVVVGEGELAVSGASTVGAGATFTVAAGATLSTGGAGASFGVAGAVAPIANNGTFAVTSGTKSTGRITGTGATTVADGAGLVLATGTAANGTTLASRVASETAELSFAGTGYMDLTNNDLVIRGSSLADSIADSEAAFAAVVSGRGASTDRGTKDHLGAGLRSSTAAADNYARSVDVLGLTAIRNGDLNLAFDSQTATKTTFDGLNVTPDDTLVRFGMLADLNFDGSITALDYFILDQGFLGRVLTRSDLSVVKGPLAGDLTGDGAVTGADYFLIDQAFLRQGDVPIDAVVEFQRAAFGDEFVAMAFSAPAGAVPEPATLSLLALGATALLGRRRRK